MNTEQILWTLGLAIFYLVSSVIKDMRHDREIKEACRLLKQLELEYRNLYFEHYGKELE